MFMNILKKIEIPYLFFLFLFFLGSSTFDRSFVGLKIFGFRLGELIVGVLLIQTLIILFLRKSSFSSLNLTKFSITINFLRVIFVCFIVSIFYFDTNFLSTYTFKTSSYIWMASVCFFAYYLFKRNYIENKFILKIVYLYLLIPIVQYLFSSGYYPNFVMDFFIKYSDKFTFTKASDIMLVLVISNLLLLNIQKNKKIFFIYFGFTLPLILPLLLEMSRGSFIGALLFFVLIVIFNFKYFLTNPKFLIFFIIFSSSVFVVSTFRISGVSFDLSQGDNIVVERSVSGSITKIAKKNETRKAFLSFYLEDGRIVSHDNTTNWRLDIWQDVVEDLNQKDSLILGYGYNEIMPIMTDPSAPGRLGRDGLNEHVHSYIFNILGRGGIVQLILFIGFHFSFVYAWYRKYENWDILLLMVPVLLNSATDMNMEGVQFPYMYYFFLGVYFKLYKNTEY